MKKPPGKMEFYSCKKSWPVMLRYRLSMLKYCLNKRKFPLFFIGNRKGGILPSRRLLLQMKARKFVRFDGHYHFSLSVPRWPSAAFDRMVAKGGLNLAAAGTPGKQQMENAIIGITGKCHYACVHCYERFNQSIGDRLPLPLLQQVVRQLQEHGTNVITLSGGEPMLRFDDLVTLLKMADHSLSDFHIHTSGDGVTPEKAVKLKEAGICAAGVALDDVDPDRHDAFRGHKGAFEQAIKAIHCFLEAGIFTYVNTCLNRELVRSGEIPRYFDFLKSLGIGFVRWLEPKPCGAWLNQKESPVLNREEWSTVRDFFIKANSSSEYRDYPVISFEAFSELPGNLGCIMGGNGLLYIDSAGNVLPCVFFPVTFGNILMEDFTAILERMRKAIPVPLRSGCPSVNLNGKLRNMKEAGMPFPVGYQNFDSGFTLG